MITFTIEKPKEVAFEIPNVDLGADAFDRGYEAGEKDGYLNGYEIGVTEGAEVGYAKGESEGYEKGHAAGVTEGVEQGKQDEYNAFWDTFQDYGKRTDYEYAFAGWSFTDDNFKPKYDIVVTACYRMFYCSLIKDIKGCLARQGVKLDTSEAKDLSSLTGQMHSTSFPAVDAQNATTISGLFYGAGNLLSAEVYNIQKNCEIGSAFYQNWELRELRLSGEIGKNFQVAQSKKLSRASFENVINTLSSSTSGLTATFSKTAVEFAFNENLFDISKLEDTSMIVKKDGQIYVTGYSCIANQTLGELCPSLKAGDTAKLRMDTTGLPRLYTTSLWTDGSTRVITENDLNAKLTFYGKSDSTTAVISDIAIVTLDAENAEWLNLVATKPNWTIALA